MRRFVSIRTLVLAAAFLSILAVLGGWLAIDRWGPAHAEGEVVISIDMNPTGNSCPGNGVNDCTIGTIDSSLQETAARETLCADALDNDGVAPLLDGRVNDGCPAVGAAETVCTGAADEDADTFINDGCPTAFLFDVVVQNLPVRGIGEGQAALDFQLRWGGSVTPPEADVFDIVARASPSATIHYLQQASGSGTQLGDPQALPRTAPPYVGSLFDLGTEETNPPWTQGTGWRGTAIIALGATSGTYTFDFVPGSLAVGNATPFDECVSGPGCITNGATIVVGAANQPPTCSNVPVTTPEDTGVAVNLNCTDPDGNPLTYSIVAGPAHGSLSGSGASRTYTPAANYNGPDSFTYKANDGTVDSNTATASITVTAVNDPPTCNSFPVSTSQDTPVAVNLNCSDIDGDAFTYSVVTPPANGALSGAAPNLTYTPNAGYSGPDSFTYKANDGAADSNTATVSITVTAPGGVDYAVTLLEPSDLSFFNPPRFGFRAAVYAVGVENLGTERDGPAYLSLQFTRVNPTCPAPLVLPLSRNTLTLNPGGRATRLFLVFFWSCGDPSPAVDYVATARVTAPGDSNPANDSKTGTVDARRRPGHWGWW